MTTEVRVPILPESVADAVVLTWHKRPGDYVRREENLVDLETDKVVIEVPAPDEGVLGEIKHGEGAEVTAETVLGVIRPATAEDSPPDVARTDSSDSPGKEAEPAADRTNRSEPPISPSARRLVNEMNLDPSRIAGSGKEGRIHKADVVTYLDAREVAAPERHPDLARASLANGEPPKLTGEAGRPEQRVKMTRLRARIAERLLEAQRTAATLTTFNEVDLGAINDLRARFKHRFEETHGVRLGLMSFFVKASVEALKRFPVINASVDGDEIVYHGYYDIGIAVASDRGLVVPILRNCDQLSMADIEGGVAAFANRAKDGTLSFDELTGGTFSITNGGVFGSMLSTPILNPPQSAILGMHKMQDRPVARDGEVVIRPMMYLALSYDHRLVDGREAVQFLGVIKETLEDPARLLLSI